MNSKFYEKPPEGMRAVLSNNKFAGYVTDTDDPIENARLARELIIEKGLHKKVSIAESMFGQATSFANAANHIYKLFSKITEKPSGDFTFCSKCSFQR